MGLGPGYPNIKYPTEGKHNLSRTNFCIHSVCLFVSVFLEVSKCDPSKV
jgi:hypothetical protein